MARQEEKIGDNIISESNEHIVLTAGEKNCNEGAQDPNLGEKDVSKGGNTPKKSCRYEYYNESDLQVWNDRCLRRNGEMKGMANKLADLQSVVNFMMQNNDTPVPTAKTDAQKGRQKTILVVSQHGKEKECSCQPSRDVGRAESVRGESQKSLVPRELMSENLGMSRGRACVLI
ncbi:hypothetical protein ACSBR2_022009 [Camellia fascicularis]